MTEKRTFREAVERAAKIADNTALSGADPYRAFLKSLEESGWKLVGPEPTEKMTNAPFFDRWSDYGVRDEDVKEADRIYRAMRAAAPTVTDLLTTKEPDER